VKLFILVPWGERLGGAESMLWTALRAFDRDRVEPIVAFMQPGRFERDTAAMGIRTHLIAASRLRRPGETVRAIRLLASTLGRDQPDLILNWSAKTQIYASPAALLAGMHGRVVWWQHGVPNGHWVDRLATLLPARAIGCSSAAGRDAQRALRPRRHTFVVTPGIEEPTRDGRSPHGPLRRELGIPDDRRVIGIVGRLQPWKGQHRFLRALAELRARGYDMHGLVVGGDAFELSPRYPAELTDLVERLGLEDFVTMTGQVDDPTPHLELMDIAVNASDVEPFGIALLEAMASRIPVVAVGRGGPLDVLDRGRCGMLARDGSPAALADAIEPLLADEALRERVADAGRERYHEQFTAQAMADRLTTRLRELNPA
jgi:glycosyltransferase involved in cell wall biosynthesis